VITKAQIKEIKSLHQPKFRQMYNKFIAEGDKVGIEFVKSQKYQIDHIYTTELNHDLTTNEHLLPITVIKRAEMEQMSALKTASGLLIVLKTPIESQESLLPKPSKAVYLDGVQDPGNVGTIIRIADWFGIDMVIRSTDSADFYNPKTVQATMGSMVNITLRTMAIEDVVGWNLPIIGTKMDAPSVESSPLPLCGIVVMGSEGRGISPQTIAHLTQEISIPGAKTKVADSLNVGIAAGIICAYWMSR
jgi:RNA methyltransferase, TrmH family